MEMPGDLLLEQIHYYRVHAAYWVYTFYLRIIYLVSP